MVKARTLWPGVESPPAPTGQGAEHPVYPCQSNCISSPDCHLLNDPSNKDSDSSFFLFGAEYLPDEKLSLTAVGGIEDRNRDGAPDGSFGFGEVFAIYRYLPDSFVSGGINFGAQETDNVGAYLDEENLGIFANIQHAVTHSIFASGSVFYESSDLNARPGTGAVDISEDSLRAGLGLTYEASDNLAIILQYDLDDTSSDDPVRDQTRHRIGVSVRYTFGVR